MPKLAYSINLIVDNGLIVYHFLFTDLEIRRKQYFVYRGKRPCEYLSKNVVFGSQQNHSIAPFENKQ